MEIMYYLCFDELNEDFHAGVLRRGGFITKSIGYSIHSRELYKEVYKTSCRMFLASWPVICCHGKCFHRI